MLLEDNYERREARDTRQWRSSSRRVDGVFETDTSVRIEVELPGVDRDRIHIEAEGPVVTVRVDRSVTFVGDEDTLYMVDDRFSGYERAFSLPSSADVASARASFSRDTLSIVVPKRRIRRSIPIEETVPTVR